MTLPMTEIIHFFVSFDQMDLGGLGFWAINSYSNRLLAHSSDDRIVAVHKSLVYSYTIHICERCMRGKPYKQQNQHPTNQLNGQTNEPSSSPSSSLWTSHEAQRKNFHREMI